MATLGARFETILTLSWRNLWRNHRRTGIMLGAIAVGVWAMIFMTALMRGMVDDMLNQGIRNLPGHIQIQHPEFLDDPNVINSIDEPRGNLLATLQRDGSWRWAKRIRVPAVVASERESRGVNLIGIEPADCGKAGELMGLKMATNEFVAYGRLAEWTPKLPDGSFDESIVSERTRQILTYGLCGFANFSSIGIQLGGIGGIAPERRSDLAKLGLRAMLGGTLAAFMTACIAGLLI